MRTRRTAERVLLIGWDGADWKLIRPLLAAGELPNLARLVEGGVVGNLATLDPILAPLLWTSMATGKRPPKHGILDFIEPSPRSAAGVRPVSSRSRRSRALWNVLTQAGLRSNLVGWFATHPAEPVHGAVVTDAFARRVGPNASSWPFRPGSVHPRRLTSELADFRIHPSELGFDELRPFVPRLAEIEGDEHGYLADLASIVAANASVHAAATWLVENEPWDLTAIYYNLIDHVSHRFMQFHPPRMEHADPVEFEHYRDVVTAAYRVQDSMLGRALELAGAGATVIVVSDHGFHCDHLRPDPGADVVDGIASWHRPYGILCMQGPGVRRGERIYGASVLDVAPTLLALFGLAVGNDMDGRPLFQAFDPPLGLKSIRSWEDVEGDFGTHPETPGNGADPWDAHESIEQLADLGYIEPLGADRQKNARIARLQRQKNLGRAHIDAGAPERAIGIFEELLEEEPGRAEYAFHLAQALEASGQLDRCRGVVEQILTRADAHPGGSLLRGSLLAAEGRATDALVELERAEESAPTLPGVQQRIGMAYLKLRRWPEAERAFHRALDLDGDSERAHYGLSVAFLRQKKIAEAVDAALRAVELRHFFPQAHFQLGVSLVHAGRPADAVRALETCLAMRPATPEAHRWLTLLHQRAFDDPERADHHRRQLEVLRGATRS